MFDPIFFTLTLATATFLCTLVAGFLLAFSTVTMPGLRQLSDGAFIEGFQVIDGVIQKGQPVFMVTWMGSTLSIIALSVLGLGHLGGIAQVVLIGASTSYVLAVIVPTFVVNVPLKTELQALHVDTLDEGGRRRAREAFEPRWNRWNNARTVFASLTSVQLVVLLLRM